MPGPEQPVHIDADIRRAHTPPGSWYRCPEHHRRTIERIFAPSWQLLPEAICASDRPRQVAPWTLLPGCLDEALLATRDDDGRLHCLSNACTHRGNLVVDAATECRTLRCRYHGRRFELDGRFAAAPGFEDAVAFPSADDDLTALAVERFGPLACTSLGGAPTFRDWIAPVRERVGWLPLDRLRLDEAGVTEYEIEANWALYCENFLEGFHIPFVHEGLNRELDNAGYRTETFEHGSLQIGIGKERGARFELPAGHTDAGQDVAAWYFFLFPNLMLNFYPWGLSVNVVQPLAPRRTRVRFIPWVLDASLRSVGAGAELHTVELEDERVVESCQRGVASGLYRRGRYAPRHEIGVHHFHRLIAAALGD